MIKLIEHWEILVGMITTFFAFLGGKKLKTIEEKKASSDVIVSVQKLYDNLVKDVDDRHSEMRLEMSTLKDEVLQLRKENSELRKELREWELKYYTIKREFDNLRA
jgi:hypothetical protein